MAGLIVAINGKPIASVSVNGLNILTAQVHGDVLGEELAALDVYGGLYGQGDADKHLIWVSDQSVSAEDEVEIKFVENVSTSYRGRTIEELHPEPGGQQIS